MHRGKEEVLSGRPEDQSSEQGRDTGSWGAGGVGKGVLGEEMNAEGGGAGNHIYGWQEWQPLYWRREQ